MNHPLYITYYIITSKAVPVCRYIDNYIFNPFIEITSQHHYSILCLHLYCIISVPSCVEFESRST